MQRQRLAQVTSYRVTGLVAAIALAVGVLLGGQIEIADPISSPARRGQNSAAPAAVRAPTPGFIVGDVDGVYHQQVAMRSGARPLFIIGDCDGVYYQQHTTAGTSGCEAGGSLPR